jgi:hypothetical protein
MLNFMNMARLFSNREYVDIVSTYSEAYGSASRAQRISVRLLGGYMKVHSFPIDAIEV